MIEDQIKIFADGADLTTARELLERYPIAGFTTNPTLMAKAGITDYVGFAKEFSEIAGTRPVSLEVFSDDFDQIRRQARFLADLGSSVCVKVPIVDSTGRLLDSLIRTLAQDGVRLNVTAVFTIDQVERAAAALSGGPPAIVSVFAGRIADAGIDPVPIVRRAASVTKALDIEVLWASAREIFTVVQAVEASTHSITLSYDFLPKLKSLGKDLTEFSQETSAMFLEDTHRSGYSLPL